MIFPQEMLLEMNVSTGEELLARKVEGGYLLTPKISDVKRQVVSGREILAKYRKTFRDLGR